MLKLYNNNSLLNVLKIVPFLKVNTLFYYEVIKKISFGFGWVLKKKIKKEKVKRNTTSNCKFYRGFFLSQWNLWEKLKSWKSSKKYLERVLNDKSK